MAQDKEQISKAEMVWGKPLTDDEILDMLNVIRLWSNEQVPRQANPWLWKTYMVLSQATEPVIADLKDARTNHQADSLQ